MSWLRRREIIILFFFIPGLVVFINHFTGGLAAINSQVVLWTSILAAFSIILGMITLFRHHGLIIIRQDEGWAFSIIALGSCIAMVGSYLVEPISYDIMVNELYPALHMAMLAYVGFFSYTVFYRSSASKSMRVLVLNLFILLGLLYNLPMSDTIWPGFKIIGTWINASPNTGGQNALRIAIALGTIVLYVRSVLGYEEAYTGG
jgi:hypothetical protein